MSAEIPQSVERFRARKLGGAGRGSGRGRAARLARLLPAAPAAYEFRYLIAHVAAAGAVLQVASARPVTLLALVSLAALAGWLLREGGRGVAARLPRPGWSLRLVSSWALCSAALAVLLLVPDLLHAWSTAGPGHAHPVVTSGWSTAAAVMIVGLVAAASLHGAGWLLRELVWLHPRACDVHAAPVAMGSAACDRRPAAAPLRAGWSDRGPPASALAAA